MTTIVCLAAILAFAALPTFNNAMNSSQSAAIAGEEPSHQGLGVELSSNVTTLRLTESLAMRITITNKTRSLVYLDGRFAWGGGTNLAFAVQEAKTARVVPREIHYDTILPPARSRDVFIGLEPDQSTTVTMSETLADMGIKKPGVYKVSVFYRSPSGPDVAFDLPVWPSERGWVRSNAILIEVRK